MNCYSPFRGVTWNKRRGYWTASIQAKGWWQSRHLGSFRSEIEAAEAYNHAVTEYNELCPDYPLPLNEIPTDYEDRSEPDQLHDVPTRPRRVRLA